MVEENSQIAIVSMALTPEEDLKIRFLGDKWKMKTRTKIFKKCLEKVYATEKI